ncbi:MAG: FAD-dependent oxidoreductase [Bacteroidales bacterium]|jgi:all-trans-retinol 13,14-reductase|nr:FAD-dependent oxidoreductase [Bacteroidales bacterium]
MKKNILIIGGGIGGLVCGAILSIEGYSVRVLEKHKVAGGGLHTFKRNDIEFETGMHLISGFQHNGTLNKLFSYIGIVDKLHIKPADEDGFDHFHVAADGVTYKMARGQDNFVKTLSTYFPEEKENIRDYIKKIYQICENIPIYNLRMPSADIYSNIEVMETSISDLIASYTDNPKLQTVLAWNNAMYGGRKNKTPAYVGALITHFYIEGASRFVGGSQHLADALVQIIEENGGEVLTNTSASFIDIKEQHILKVVAENGKEYMADWYISSIHPSSMFKIVDTCNFKKAYYQRIDNIQNSNSAFITFVTFKPQSFPYQNYSNFYAHDYDDVWNCAEYTSESWPRGCMYLTPPMTYHDTFAKKMIISTIMKFDSVKKWENTTIGKRGPEYENFKTNYENKVLDMMEKIFPDFRSKINTVFSASPLTIRDYYNVKEGAIYGTISDCNNMPVSQIPIRTKIDNFLLTGQNINLHGILGVPLTAILTCGELIGLDKLLKNIKEKNLSLPTFLK